MASLPLRQFAEPACTIADQWFREPFYPEQISLIGDYTRDTADGSCEAALACGHSTYVKPRPDAEQKLLIGREKIAADLGHMLDLPVAPAAIRKPVPDQGWPHYTLLSLVCLPGGRLWRDGGANHVGAAAEPLEALRAFWTWIGDADHGGNDRNLLYEVMNTTCAVVSIDHGHALGRNSPDDPLGVPASPGYGSAAHAHVVDVCRETVVKIQALEEGAIVDVVRRLSTVLTDTEQDQILNILKVRRDKLPGLLGF